MTAPADLHTQPISIRKLVFDAPSKVSLLLADGRALRVPLRYFPQIKKMSLDKRRKYTIVDDRTILFRHSDQVYHLEDFIGLEGKWRQR